MYHFSSKFKSVFNKRCPKTIIFIARLNKYKYVNILVFNKEEGSFYVHHDIILPWFPLCIEWLSHDPTDSQPGKLIIVFIILYKIFITFYVYVLWKLFVNLICIICRNRYIFNIHNKSNIIVIYPFLQLFLLLPFWKYAANFFVILYV